jgi:hypothetical protein
MRNPPETMPDTVPETMPKPKPKPEPKGRLGEFVRRRPAVESIRNRLVMDEVLTTTCPSTHALLQSLRDAYLDEGASDEHVPPAAQVITRDYLVYLLRAEVYELDDLLRNEMLRRKELERGLSNWRWALENLERLDAGTRDVDL